MKIEDAKKVAQVLKTSPSTLKAGIEQGVIPFGACIKTEKGSVTVLFPEKVKEYCGVNLDY